MKLLKYVSLCVLILGGASCWGMEEKKVSFSDMKIEHKSYVISDEKMHGIIYLCLNQEKIGLINYDAYQVTDPLLFVTKHICTHFDEYTSKEACIAPFVKCKSAVKLNTIKLAGNFQQQGLGKQFMHYFLNHIRDTQVEPVVWLDPAQSFYKKDRSITVSEWLGLSQELNQRLLRFYQYFGAAPYEGRYGSLYIDLKTEKTAIAPVWDSTELPF